MPRKNVTAETMLREIEKVASQRNPHVSRQAGKKFYEAGTLPKLLDTYLLQRQVKPSAHAQHFGMSSETLRRILDGNSISENMLFRLKQVFEDEVKSQQRGAIYPGDWRSATAGDVQESISVVTQRLIYLKKIIESSNFLKSQESPIDKIQVAQLVGLLVATLEAIKAPLIDRHQTRGFISWLGKLGKRSVEKGIENRVSKAIGDAVDAGNDLIAKLAEHSETVDLGDIIT